MGHAQSVQKHFKMAEKLIKENRDRLNDELVRRQGEKKAAEDRLQKAKVNLQKAHNDLEAARQQVQDQKDHIRNLERQKA